MGVAASALLALTPLLFGPSGLERWRAPELAVRERIPASTADEIRELALAYLGRPYVMGGVGSPGFDCSGLVCRVYAEAGYSLPRVSRDQALAGRAVPRDRIEPGDLVFFSSEPGRPRIGHVGIYLGDGEIVHASTTDGEVEIANLGASWFQKRFVAARRVLPDPDAPSIAGPPSRRPPARGLKDPVIAPRELVEHVGESSLPPMLRLLPRRHPPSFGPELSSANLTSIGVRSLASTEAGELGFVLAPEAALRVDAVALAIAVAVPVRFERGRPASIGELDRFADYLRFLRSASLGLRGADLDLRLSRLGDATLGDGFLLDKLAPGSVAPGIAGLTVARTPLSFFGGVRGGGLDAQALIDDVVDPGLAGLHATLDLGASTGVRGGAGFVTDQRAVFGGARRAVNAGELQLTASLVGTRRWSLDLGASAASIRALADAGYGARAAASVEHRFAGASSFSLSIHGAWLGRAFLDRFFGPTYLVARDAHLRALAEVTDRGMVGGEAVLTLGRFVLGASHADGLGRRGHPLDRETAVLLELGSIPLGSTRVASLRVAYAARGIFEGERMESVLFGGLSIRMNTWLRAEVYAQKGDAFEGGAGLTISYTP